MTVSVSSDKVFSKSLIPPQIMECSISLPKSSMKQMCKDYNISYRRTIIDYDLSLPYYNEISSSDSSDDQLNVTPNYSPIPWKSKSKKKKKKMTERYTNPSKSKRKLTEELTPNNKRQKTWAKTPNPIVNGFSHSEDSHDMNEMSESTPKTTKTKKKGKNTLKTNHLSNGDHYPQSPPQREVITKKMINGKPHMKVKAVRLNNNHSVNHNNNQNNEFENFIQNSNKNSKLRKRLTKPKSDINHNKVIDLFGGHFRHSDIFDDHCECEQNCELDELSMAFHILMTFPENQLPKDLQIAVVGRSSDLLCSEDDKSDPNLDELLPGVDDIYQQTIEETFLDDYISDFVMKTSQINGVIPSVNPSINMTEPQPSCSGVSTRGLTNTSVPTNGVPNGVSNSLSNGLSNNLSNGSTGSDIPNIT